jgi:hypothetical protein
MGDVPSMLPVPMARPRGSGDISNLVVVVVVMVVWMVVNILLPEGGSSRVPAKSRSMWHIHLQPPGPWDPTLPLLCALGDLWPACLLWNRLPGVHGRRRVRG